MGRAPRELTPLESAQHFFGAELRHWRTLREFSQVALGQLTHDSGALISKVEKGERFPSRELTHRLDEALDTGGVFERLWPQVERERAARDSLRGAPPPVTEPLPDNLGLAWSPTLRGTVEVVRALWRAELERRPVCLVDALRQPGRAPTAARQL